jgi:hypothetical protein
MEKKGLIFLEKLNEFLFLSKAIKYKKKNKYLNIDDNGTKIEWTIDSNRCISTSLN